MTSKSNARSRSKLSLVMLAALGSAGCASGVGERPVIRVGAVSMDDTLARVRELPLGSDRGSPWSVELRIHEEDQQA